MSVYKLHGMILSYIYMKSSCKKVIFIVFSGHVVVRNFLAAEDNLLTHLNQKECKLVVIVPKRLEISVSESLKHLDGVQVETVDLNLRKSIAQNIFTFITTHLTFTLGARMLAKYGVRLDVPVAGGNKYLYPIKVLIAETAGRCNWVKVVLVPYLDRLFYRKRYLKYLFIKYNPDGIFCSNIHNNIDVEMLREAKRCKVKSFGMPGSWDHLPKKFEPVHSDILFVWTDFMKKEAIELQSYKESKICVVGVPYYDLFSDKNVLLSRKEFFKQSGLTSDKKIIFFISGTVYAPDDGDVAKIIALAINNKEINESVQLFIRPYPKDPNERNKFKEVDGMQSVVIDKNVMKKSADNQWFSSINEVKHFINCLYHADLIIHTYSSVAVEASIFNKQTICINFDGYQSRPFNESLKRFEKMLIHYFPLVETGGVEFANNQKHLKYLLNKLLDNPEVNIYNIKSLRNKMCGNLDGKTGERIADILASVE